MYLGILGPQPAMGVMAEVHHLYLFPFEQAVATCLHKVTKLACASWPAILTPPLGELGLFSVEKRRLSLSATTSKEAVWGGVQSFLLNNKQKDKRKQL